LTAFAHASAIAEAAVSAAKIKTMAMPIGMKRTVNPTNIIGHGSMVKQEKEQG
jgi:hypothetical protein